MSAQQMLAVSLILSVLASGAAWGVGALIERISDDPRLRDRVWGAGLIFGLLPVLAVGVLVLTPAPVREVVAPAPPVFISETVASAPAPGVVERPVWPGPHTLSWAVLIAAAAFGLIRLIALALRTFRLARLIARAVPVGPDIQPRIEGIASRLKVQPPLAFTDATSGEALLTGLCRPRLILPASDHPVADAVIAHELAHLKRGDHRTLWLEEAIAVLLAFNPMIPVLRARRDAAREEACDALALSGSDTETRRAYAQTLIQALRDRAGSQGPRVALTFTGAARKAAMKRLNAVTTPAAPAGRRVRWVAMALGLSFTIAAGAATAALASQRETEIRMASAPSSNQAAEEGTSAAQAATQAALAALSPEARERFQGASAADYRAFCASTDVIDDGFCAGVMFSHLARAPGNGLCVPETGVDSGARLGEIVARGKAEIARLEPRRDEGAYEYSERALKAAYPCGIEAATSAGLPDGPALTVRIGRSQEPFVLGSGSVLRVVLQSQDGERGARNISRMEMPIVPDQPLERELFFRLKEEQLPTLTSGQVYDLTAEIRDVDGRVVYAAEPVAVRMAPGSRGRLAAMRPELVLTRTVAATPPSASIQAYQARLTISVRGQVVASERLRLLPDNGDASTILTADGSDYRYGLRLARAEPASGGEEQLTLSAEVLRAASSGRWEPEAKPVLLMRADGKAQMQWGSEAGLSFDILVEPA